MSVWMHAIFTSSSRDSNQVGDLVTDTNFFNNQFTMVSSFSSNLMKNSNKYNLLTFRNLACW